MGNGKAEKGRVTVHLSDEQIKELKHLAIDKDITLSQLFTKIIKRYFKENKE